nr:HlyU family transcriptional regulator [uncultured Gellertiella sp.]
MTSFVSKFLSFLGTKPADAGAATTSSRESYQDVELVAHPLREGNQFRISGTIERRSGDSLMQRHFIRADVFSNEKDAVDFTFRKARQIVDQQGQTLFQDGAAEGRI